MPIHKDLVRQRSRSKKSPIKVGPYKFAPYKLSLTTKLAFVVVFATVGGYLLYRSFAATPPTTGYLVAMMDEQPVQVTRDSNGAVHYSAQNTVFGILADNTLVCGDKNAPDYVSTAQLSAKQTNEIAKRVVDAGLASQPDEINTTGNPGRVSGQTWVAVNTNGVSKTVSFYGNSQSDRFDRDVRAIAKDICKQATKTVKRSDAPSPKQEVVKAGSQSQRSSTLAWVERNIAPKAYASGYSALDEGIFYHSTDFTRYKLGKVKLADATCLRNRARAWSYHMASVNTMYHTSNLSGSISKYCGVGSKWSAVGENVGYSPAGCTNAPYDYCAQLIFNIMLDESKTGYDGMGHYLNFINNNYRYQGIGAYVDSRGGLWITQDFLACFSSCGISTYSPSVYTSWHLAGRSNVRSATAAPSTQIYASPGQAVTYYFSVTNFGPDTANYATHVANKRYSPAGVLMSSNNLNQVSTTTGWRYWYPYYGYHDSLTVPATAQKGEKFCQYIYYQYANGPGTAAETSPQSCAIVL